jgi:hypothetical protein
MGEEIPLWKEQAEGGLGARCAILCFVSGGDLDDIC